VVGNFLVGMVIAVLQATNDLLTSKITIKGHIRPVVWVWPAVLPVLIPLYFYWRMKKETCND